MNAFYVKANECHRFLSWIKHYLELSIDKRLSDSLQRQATALGVNIQSCISSGLALEHRLEEGGIKFSSLLNRAFEEALIQNISSDRVRLAHSFSISSSKFSTTVFFERSVRSFAAKVIVTRSQADLIDSWAKFMDFYVLPGCPLMQHAIRNALQPPRYCEELPILPIAF